MDSQATTLEGSAFSRFMASCEGRIARAGLGVSLITLGLASIGGWTGMAVATAGLVPLGAGVFNLCPVAPAWGGHFVGAKYCGVRKPE